MYQQVAELHPHVGITLQAHLYRTQRDLEALVHLPGKIRLVKGAYQEFNERAMKRGEALDERFLSLIQVAVSAQHSLSIATHDQHLLQEVERRKFLIGSKILGKRTFCGYPLSMGIPYCRLNSIYWNIEVKSR